MDYKVLVQGNNLALKNGFLGLSSIVLIRTPQGPVLFDTGHHTTRPALLAALRAEGLAPGDVPIVILSHLHFDHANNIDLFPQAQVYVSAREFAYAADPHPEDMFIPAMIREQVSRMNLTLLEQEGEIVPGLRWIAAPGHTPGLISLVLDTEAAGCVVLASDAIKYAKEAVTGRCDLTFDTPETGTRTIQRILAMADRIVPGHFPELIKRDGVWTWDEAAEVTLLVR